MLQNIGLTELTIIILVLIIFFGSKRINELAGQAGEATRELKKIEKEYKETLEEVKKEPEEKRKEGGEKPKKVKKEPSTKGGVKT